MQRRVLEARPEVDGQIRDAQLAAQKAENELDERDEPPVGLRDDVDAALGERAEDTARVELALVELIVACNLLADAQVLDDLRELLRQRVRRVDRLLCRRVQHGVRTDHQLTQSVGGRVA